MACSSPPHQVWHPSFLHRAGQRQTEQEVGLKCNLKSSVRIMITCVYHDILVILGYHKLKIGKAADTETKTWLHLPPL